MTRNGYLVSPRSTAILIVVSGAVLVGGLSARAGTLILGVGVLLLILVFVGVYPAVAIGLSVPLSFYLFGAFPRDVMNLAFGFQLRELAFIFLVMAAALQWLHGRRLKVPPFRAFLIYPMLVLAAYVFGRVLLTCLEGYSLLESFRLARTYFAVVGYYFAVTILLSKKEEVRDLANLMIFYGVYVAIVEISFQMAPQVVARMLSPSGASPTIQANYGGAYISKLYLAGSLIVPWAFFATLFKAIQRASWWNTLLALVTLLGTIAIMWRSIWVAAGFALVATFAALSWSSRRVDLGGGYAKRFLLVLIGLAVGTALIAAVLPEVRTNLIRYAPTVFDEVMNRSGNYGARLAEDTWRWRLIWRSPILGVGFINYSDPLWPWKDSPIGTSNSGYVTLLGYGGFLLVGAIIWILAVFSRKALEVSRTRPDSEYAWLWKATLAYVFFLLVANYAGFGLSNDDGLLFLMIGMGLSDVSLHLSNRPTTHPASRGSLISPQLTLEPAGHGALLIQRSPGRTEANGDPKDVTHSDHRQ